jgi:cysteine-rich repeat protein
MLTRSTLPFVLLPCLLASVGCSDGEAQPQGDSTPTAPNSGGPHDTGSDESSTTSAPGETSTTSTDTSPDESTTPDDSTAETGPDSSATTEMTTGPSPVCGNGIVEPDEECDDGDLIPDNGCSDTCTADIRAFVSSITYQAGDLMSLVLADALCFNRADDAKLPEPLRFKAFLSDSQTDARDRFKGRGRIVFVNGIVFADSWGALLAGELLGPMEVTEKSETYHGKVWTGTRPDGTAAADSTHCADWSSDSPVDAAYYGYSDEVSAEWLLADQLDNPAECYVPLAIYCFETS